MAKKKRRKSPKKAVKSKSAKRVATPKVIRPVAMATAPKKMNTSKLFLGGIFLLVALYIFLTQTGIATQMFGGGVVALLALVFLYAGFKGE